VVHETGSLGGVEDDANLEDVRLIGGGRTRGGERPGGDRRGRGGGIGALENDDSGSSREGAADGGGDGVNEVG
jgi:hypothetical protein